MFDKLIDFIIQFIDLFRFFFIIAEYEGALVLRFGKLHRQAPPGFHWKWPFEIEKVLSVNVVLETAMIGPQSLTTKDDQPIIISAVITYTIEDVKKFLLEVEGGHQVLEDSAYGTISSIIKSKTWNELREMDIDNELTKKIRRLAGKYGVAVSNVQATDFTKSRSIRIIEGHWRGHTTTI